MKRQDLPETYKGYSTGELLRLWNMLRGPHGFPEETPMEMRDAMNDLLDDFKIPPVAWDQTGWTDEDLAAKKQDLRDLLVSYGIKPERL